MFFLAGVADAFSYIKLGQISLKQIHDLSIISNNLEDFLYDFIKMLMMVDV
jgi:hypothetical protein